MTIFLILNGMGFVFMLYVLVNFLKEGKRTQRGGTRDDKRQSPDGSKVRVLVATHTVELVDGLPEGSAVIPFPLLKGIPVGGGPAPDGGKPSQRKYSIG